MTQSPIQAEKVTDDPKVFVDCNMVQHQQMTDSHIPWQRVDHKAKNAKELWSSDFAAGDLVRLAKQYYQRPSTDPVEDFPCTCQAEEITIRSRTLAPCGYASAVPCNYLEAKNDRRKDVLQKGQLAYYAQPYIELGRVQPGSQLFVHNILPFLSANVLELMGKKEDSTAIKPSVSRDNVRKRQTQKENGDLIIRCEINERERQSMQAGQKEINEMLAETSARLKRMQANDSYVSHVREMELHVRQQQLEQVLMTNIDEMNLQEVGSEQELSGKETTGNLSWKRQRLLQILGRKLFYIYLTLCCVHNIKHRYLRSRNPLTSEQLKALKKDLRGTAILEPSKEELNNMFLAKTWTEVILQPESKMAPDAFDDMFEVTIVKTPRSRSRNSTPFKVEVSEKKQEWKPYPGLTPDDPNFPQRLDVLKAGPKGHYGLYGRTGARVKEKPLHTVSEGSGVKGESKQQKLAGPAPTPGALEQPKKDAVPLMLEDSLDQRPDRSDSTLSTLADGSTVTSSLPDGGVASNPPQSNGNGGSTSSLATSVDAVAPLYVPIPVPSQQRMSQSRRPSTEQRQPRTSVGKKTPSAPQRTPDKQKADLNVETWEDLMAVQPGQRLKQNRKKTQPLWQTFMQTSTGPTQPPPAANTSPQANQQGAPTDLKTSDLQTHMNTYHPHEALNRIRIANIKMKEAKQNLVKHELEKYERERIIKYCYRLRALDQLCPLFEHQLDYMDYLRREAARDPVFVTEETCAWYEDLNREAVNLGCRNNPWVLDLMTKVWSFVLADVHTLPFLKSKLCLLTLSLPVFEICQLHWQSSIKFVLVRILGCSPDLFKEWIESRGLFVLDDEGSQASSSTEVKQDRPTSPDDLSAEAGLL